MKNYLNICAVICIGVLMTACSKNDQEKELKSPSLSFQLSIGGNGSANGPRRIVTNGATMQTAFTVNDEAGVFAVRGGEIMPRVNNLKLTYNQNGVWVPAAMVPYSEEYNDAIFYAYYPYSDTVTIDLTKDDVFTSVIADFQPSVDQSTAALFGKADLMTTGACRLGNLHSVSLPMEHRMALATIELPNVSYVFTNPDIEPYILVSPENVQFSLEEGGELKPYFDETTQAYQLILRPELQDKLVVSYENAGEAVKEEIDQIANIWSGEYARFVIGGGASVTTMTLQVGDYFLSDGNLLSKDASDEELAAAKPNIVGVVCSLGTTEAIAMAKASCTHACVIATAEQRAAWGTANTTSPEENAAGWRYWYRDRGFTLDISEAGGVTKPEKIDQAMLVANGYENTLVWRTIPVGLEIGGYVVDMNSVFAATDEAYLLSHIAPTVTTEWYIPSLKEWQNIRANADAVSASLVRIGATLFQWDNDSPQNYWSSNIRSAVVLWGYTGIGTASIDLFQTVNANMAANYRYMLAF